MYSSQPSYCNDTWICYRPEIKIGWNHWIRYLSRSDLSARLPRARNPNTHQAVSPCRGTPLVWERPRARTGYGFADIETDDQTSPDDKAVVEFADDKKDDTEVATDGVTTNGHDTTADEQPPSEDDLELFFTEHGILEPCPDSDDLCLTGTFETAWLAEIDSLKTTEITAALITDIIGIETEDKEFELTEQDEVRILQADNQPVSQWPSEAALLADIAACRVLRSEIADWNEYKLEKKGQILNSLRMFIETCPTTGGDIQMGEEVVESCCSSHKVIAVTCEESGERLFEHPLPESKH